MREAVLGVIVVVAIVVLLGQFLRNDLSAGGQCSHDALELSQARKLRRMSALHPGSLFALHLTEHEQEGHDDA